MPEALAPAGVSGLCYPGVAANIDLWTNRDSSDRQLALSICFQCPIMVACRKQAEERGEDDSVAGGIDWQLVRKPPTDDGKQRISCPKCFRRVQVKDGILAKHYLTKKVRRVCPMSNQPVEAVNSHAV